MGSAFTTGGTLNAYTSTSPVNLASGDPIQVTLGYNGSNLVENLVNQTTGQKYSTTYSGVNLAAATAGTSAYVGFTGATGGLFAIQTISDFQFTAGLGNGNPSGLPAATALAVSKSAVFDFAGASQAVASLSDGSGGGSVINSARTLLSVLTLNRTDGSTTFSGSILGGGTLGAIEMVLSDTGMQVLSGTNTYTGGTFVTDGTLIATNPEALPDGSNLMIGNALAFDPIIPSDAAPSASPPPVPEPGTLGLILALLGGAVTYRASFRRRRVAARR